MKYYCETIPITLAEKLKEKGCEHPYAIPEAWEYGFIFDWLMKEEIYITIERNILDPAHYYGEVFRYTRFETLADGDTWHEAANAAIEKALTLI